jgi:hypothetical protein
MQVLKTESINCLLTHWLERAKMAVRNNSPNRTMVYIYRVMQNVFKHAVDWQMLKKNPMSGTNKPKIDKKNVVL